MDALILIYIATQADTRTGVWNGSAGALAGEIALSSSNARRILERLTEGRYIRRFPVPGRHVCYPILVHKFLVTDGEHKGQLLNAFESASPTELRYMPSEPEYEQTREHSVSQKRIETRERRRNPSPETAKALSQEGMELALLLKKLVLGNNPDAKITESQLRNWAYEVDRMVRIDKRKPGAIREVIEFSQADSFWQSNILSGAKLREKFDQLWLKRASSAKQGQCQKPQRSSENSGREDARPYLEPMPPIPCAPRQ
jgi:hypothetical protein